MTRLIVTYRDEMIANDRMIAQTRLLCDLGDTQRLTEARLANEPLKDLSAMCAHPHLLDRKWSKPDALSSKGAEYLRGATRVTDLISGGLLDSEEVCGLMLAASCHDIGHNARNNAFHIR